LSSPGELVARRLRLLVCTPKYAPQVGGAETWLRALLDALVDRGHEVSVVARSAPGVPQRSRIHGVAIERISGGRAAFAGGISAAVRELRPDAVVAHYSALPPAVWAAHRAKVPAVGIVHDVYGWRESRRIKGIAVGTLRHLGLERSLHLLRPDAFLVNSASTAARLRPLSGGRPVTVIPAGADHLDVGDEPAGPGADVVFVGRLVPQKGAGDLLEAVRSLHQAGRKVSALVVGTGPMEPQLRSAAAGSGDSVTIAGRLDDDELDAAVRGASMLALPSTREGWGLAITEAAARGVPYIAYDIPAVREQHTVLQGGVLVPANPRALAEAIRSLLDDPDRRRSLGETGRANAASLRWADAAAVAEHAISAVAGTNAPV
jgi:glycosyltransferase involved in cell wall biosynthesis